MDTITFIAMLIIIICLFIANWQQSKHIKKQNIAISLLTEANDMLLGNCNEMIACLKTVGEEMEKAAYKQEGE